MPPLEPLNHESICRHCRAFDLEIHTQLESTQTHARQRLNQGRHGPAAILAESQSAGRGQQGRPWWSPPGAAIYLTAIWPTPRAPAQLAGLSLAAGLAIRRMLGLSGIEAQLKWPNDVWIAQRKLAGVLIDVVNRPPGAHLLVGIGLNLRLPASTTQLLDQPWTELAQWLTPLPSRNLLIGQLLRSLENVLRVFDVDGFNAFAEEWHAADGLFQRQVWLRTSARTEQGQALGVDQLGRLRVDIGGNIALLSAGEVSVRPL